VCVCLIVACIVVYFFTSHKSDENNSSALPEVTSQITLQTTIPEETTAEEISEVTETPEITVVTDADGSEYEIKLMESGDAVVSVDEGSLRLRAYPSTEAAILGEIPNGQKVTVIGSCGEWYYILEGEREGYVFSDYITLSSFLFFPYTGKKI
jgi:uncharacterized protein YgiM (DUF1202 family)